MANYIYKGKKYTFRAILPDGKKVYSNNENALLNKVEELLGPKGKNWTWSSGNNGYSMTVRQILSTKSKNKSKQKSKQDKTKKQAGINQRRTNYNELAKAYGLNSRNDVRELLKILVEDFGYEYVAHPNGVKNRHYDGYLGPQTWSAYLAAWEDPEKAKILEEKGYSRPQSPGISTIKAGNRTVVATDQNIKVANELANADEFVRKNYGSDKQFNYYTLGIPRMLSLTHNVGTVAKAVNGDYSSVGEGLMDWWLGDENAGIFEINPVREWGSNNPRAASIINYGTDIVAPYAISKTLPKVKGFTQAVGENIENIAVTNAENQMPRMKVTPSQGGRGNGNIVRRLMETYKSNSPGNFRMTSGETPRANGQFSSVYPGPGSSNITMVYDAPKLAFTVNPVAYARTLPYGQGYSMPINYHYPSENNYSGLMYQIGQSTLGENPYYTYLPIWQFLPDENDLHSAENF